MADHAVSNTTQLSAACAASVGGDTITLAPGIYANRTVLVSRNKSSMVTLRPADINNPPVISGATSGSEARCFHGDNLSNFTFDGLVFRTNVLEGTTTFGGPNAGTAIDFTSFSNITFRNCIFSGFWIQIRVDRSPGGSGLRFEWCRFERSGMDDMNFFKPVNGLNILHCEFNNPNINQARAHEDPRHPDGIQFAINGTDVGSSNVNIHDNYIRTFSGYKQMIFPHGGRDLNTEALINANGYRNWSVRRNYLEGSHTHGILVSMYSNSVVDGNLIRRIDDAIEGQPTITYLGRGSWGTTVSNNVTPDTRDPKPTGVTETGNVVSLTAVPTGWVDPIVGPYGNAGAVAPDVTSVTLNDVSYTVGDTATVTHQFIWGNGTVGSRVTTYQWRRSGAAISGATASTYAIVAADDGTALSCTVTLSTSNGSDFMTSASSAVGGPVAPVPDVGTVTLNSSAYQVGQVATVTYQYSHDPATSPSHLIEWRRNGVTVASEIVNFTNPRTVVDLPRLNVIKARLASSTQPQQGALANLNSAATAALSFTANPLNSYSFASAAEVATSRNAFIANGTPAYAAALKYRLSGLANYADKAVQILNAWKTMAPDMVGNDPDGHPGLHIGSHLAPCFMYTVDLLRGYAGLEAIIDDFEQWWYDECVVWMQTVINAKMSGAVSSWRLDNWVDAANNGLISTAVAFGDASLQAATIARLAQYFSVTGSTSRYMQQPWGVGGAMIWVVRDDVTRNDQATSVWEGAQYTGYGQGSAWQAFQTALHCGTNLITANQAILASIVNNWVGWSFFGQPFNHPSLGSFTPKIDTAPSHRNMIEFGIRHFPTLMSANAKTYATNNRPFTSTERDLFTTMTMGELTTAVPPPPPPPPVPVGPLYENSVASTSFDYIHATDPNHFVSAPYSGFLVREVPGVGNVNVHVFAATFDDCPNTIEMYMTTNPQDASTYANQAAAQVDVDRYTPRLGKLPLVYRRNIHHMIGYAGNGIDSPGETLTSEDAGHFFMIYADRATTRIANNDLEESFFHEATHASIQEHGEVDGLTLDDYDVLGSPEWLAAVAADNDFITEYAMTQGQEDLAEHALFAYTLIFNPTRIPEPDRTWIAAKIPNRIAFFRTIFE